MTANAQNPAPPQLQRGDRIDKFEIIEQIGAGGMSIVWKAYDKLLDRHVAIKQILPDRSGNQDDGELRERFRREVQTQKRLGQTHKHLVRVFDVIEDNRDQAGHLQVNNPSPMSGCFISRVKLGDVVKKGQIYGTVSDILGDQVIDMPSPVDGLVILLRTFPMVKENETLAVIIELDQAEVLS